jgi:hypothetical protein
MSDRNAAGKVGTADGGLALVGVLMVGLWATPGWAKKAKEEEKPKPIEFVPSVPRLIRHTRLDRSYSSLYLYLMTVLKVAT